MAGESKTELERQFWEKWKMSILDLFRKKEQRDKQEQTELEVYIQFIYEYTDIHGVRETARRLEDAGRKTHAIALSQIRNGQTEHYGFDYIAELAQAISNLTQPGDEKNGKNK